MIGLIDRYDSGTYFFDDNEIDYKKISDYSKERNKKIGYVMQNFSLIEDYSVAENVMMPLDFSKNKMSNAEKKKRVKNAAGE